MSHNVEGTIADDDDVPVLLSPNDDDDGDDDDEAVENRDYIEETSVSDEDALKMWANIKQLDNKMEYAAAEKAVIHATKNGNMIKEDMTAFVIDGDSKTAKSIVSAYMNSVQRGSKSDVQYENERRIIGSGACHNILTLRILSLLVQKGIATIA